MLMSAQGENVASGAPLLGHSFVCQQHHQTPPLNANVICSLLLGIIVAAAEARTPQTCLQWPPCRQSHGKASTFQQNGGPFSFSSPPIQNACASFCGRRTSFASPHPHARAEFQTAVQPHLRTPSKESKSKNHSSSASMVLRDAAASHSIA